MDSGIDFDANQQYSMIVRDFSRTLDKVGRRTFFGQVIIDEETIDKKVLPGFLMYETMGTLSHIAQSNGFMSRLERTLEGETTGIDPSNVPVRIFEEDDGLCYCVPYMNWSAELNLVRGYTVEEAHRYFKSNNIFLAYVYGFGSGGDPMVAGYDENENLIKGYLSSNMEYNPFMTKIYEKHIKPDLKIGSRVLVRTSESRYNERSGLYFFDPALHITDQDKAQASPEGAIIEGSSLGNFFTQIDASKISNLYVAHQNPDNPDDAMGYVKRDGDKGNFLVPVVIREGFRGGLVNTIIQAYIFEDLKPKDKNIIIAGPWK